ncbi:FmdB family zinc ribbon protein [Methylococcus mesophilus]|uniref:FmdB family zinc ribbon protein n=1 Tax=Methylococcus mesophilus TaxID=2993564 RepID=UPI00224B2183|nr:zinc ribbon domain-containing protein [Methylococcus mesophilus]UZR27271.1 zinc ribbon domain-containing protein [Methylococcus mesophilus]
MPLYDFLCRDCGQTSELLLKLSDTPVCPHCGGSNMEKQLAQIAPHMKTPGMLQKTRAQAAKEGHFSNYKPSERPRLK